MANDRFAIVLFQKREGSERWKQVLGFDDPELVDMTLRAFITACRRKARAKAQAGKGKQVQEGER